MLLCLSLVRALVWTLLLGWLRTVSWCGLARQLTGLSWSLLSLLSNCRCYETRDSPGTRPAILGLNVTISFCSRSIFFVNIHLITGEIWWSLCSMWATVMPLWELTRVKSIVVKVEGKPAAEWIRRETRKLDALGVNCVGDDTDGG